MSDRDLTEKLSGSEFLSEIEELAMRLRRDIEAHEMGLDASAEAIRERRRRVLVEADFRFFAYTYFPHHIRGESSTFQADFCERFPKLLRLKGGATEWWVAPRGECKSSLLTKIGSCWIAIQALLEKPEIRSELGWAGDKPVFNDYVGLLGAELSMPTKLIEVIKVELTANNTLALDFPEACGKGDKWKVGEIVTRTGVKFEPWGAEQAIRGTFFGASRPKVLMGDDLITDKEAKSPTERDNRWNWFNKAVDYLGPPDGSVKALSVGTILNKDDLVSRAKHTVGHTVHHYKAIEKMPDHMALWEQCEELMRNDDRLAEQDAVKSGEMLTTEQLPSYLLYRAQKAKMERGAKTSWPSVRSLYWLMRQRAKNRAAFGSEMQGEPRTDEDQVFKDWQFWVQKLPHWIYYGACDPSMGKGETSDPSAILVGGYDTETHRAHIVEAAIKRRVPSKLSSDLISMQKEYNCVLWGFENNNAYEHMRKTIIDEAIRLNVVLPLIGITATVPAEVRIDSLEPYVVGIDARILFHSRLTQLLDELRDWPEKQSHHHYDGLVALQILWMMVVTRAGGRPSVVSLPTRNISTRGYD